jgi:hypothetical protein
MLLAITSQQSLATDLGYLVIVDAEDGSRTMGFPLDR